jgi:HD-GYP domain-containing protein (c-di-GMP phosphodiesterase class II)
MPVSNALAIMTDMLDTQLDPLCFDALKRALERVDASLAA